MTPCTICRGTRTVVTLGGASRTVTRFSGMVSTCPGRRLTGSTLFRGNMSRCGFNSTMNTVTSLSSFVTGCPGSGLSCRTELRHDHVTCRRGSCTAIGEVLITLYTSGSRRTGRCVRRTRFLLKVACRTRKGITRTTGYFRPLLRSSVRSTVPPTHLI